MALCVSAVTASSSLRLLASTASVEFCGTRLSVNCAINCGVKGRSSCGVQVLRCVKSGEAAGGERSYAEEEAVHLNRLLSKEGSNGHEAVHGAMNEAFVAELGEGVDLSREDVEVEVIGQIEHIQDGEGAAEGEGEENDYWSRNGAGTSSETTIIYPQANQRVEEDLLKRIRYQNGREVCDF